MNIQGAGLKPALFRALRGKKQSVEETDMLSVEDNNLLTRIEPGTPTGSLFRRY